MMATQVNVTTEAAAPHPTVRDRAAAVVLVVGLAFGLLAERLFYGKAPGLSYPLFIGLGLAALAVLSRGWAGPRAGRAWLLALPVLFFATAVAVRAHEFLSLLNVAASLGVLAVLAYALAGPSWVRLPLIGYPLAAARALAEAAARPPVLVLTGIDVRGVGVADRSRVAPVLRGLLLALPAALVFAALFASADLVFNRYLAEILDLDILAHLRRLTGHAVFVLAAAWFVAGGLAFALRRAWSGDGRLLGAPARWLVGAGLDEAGVAGLRRFGQGLMAEGVICRPWAWPRLGVTEAIIVLSAVVALFLAFVAIQATYLFGGQANIAAEGFTYAEYARRGFFELVFVAMLALGMGLGLLQIVRTQPGRADATFRALLTALAALVLVVLASAAQRLLLYESAYGFTAQRLYSHVFMAVLAGVLVWFIVTLWWRPERFAVGAFVAMMVYVAALDVINPDAFIVRQNLARYEATGDLDTDYLWQLSPDAVPALAAALPGLRAPERDEVEAALAWEEARLADRAPASWASRHLGQDQARAVLARLTLPEPVPPPWSRP